jgi:trafficking protein particle complex subunit 11
MRQILVHFQGDKYLIKLSHQKGSDQAVHANAAPLQELRKITLKERPSSTPGAVELKGSTDLTISPSSLVIIEFSLVVREAGGIHISYIALSIESDQFELQYHSPSTSTGEPSFWWTQKQSGLKAIRLGRAHPEAVTVLPRPPKMEITLVDAEKQYYTDEAITLKFVVSNQEEEETESTLEVRFMSRTVNVPDYVWISAEDHGGDAVLGSNSESTPEALPGHAVGRLLPGTKSTHKIRLNAPSIPADLVVEAKVLYHLLSDRETPVSKTLSTSFDIMSAFEANYEFTPRVHPDPWPTFFGVQSLEDAELVEDDSLRKANGIAQRWRLFARIASFAEEALSVEGVSVQLDSISGNALCEISNDIDPSISVVVAPRELHERTFSLDVTKISLEDRRPSTLGMSLSIQWRRTSAPISEAVTSTLLMQDMAIPNSEPRVLATAYPSSNAAIPILAHLDYVLENPTTHFLTFDLTMEASEEFAFGGLKFGAVNLLPLSRTTVRFNVLPLVRGAWVSPSLKVMDRYFGKQLKVLGTDGLRTDKKGIGLWVDDDEGS